MNSAWEIPRIIYQARNDSFPEREGLEPHNLEDPEQLYNLANLLTFPNHVVA